MEERDPRLASIWAAKAVELMPGDNNSRLLLANAFAALNMKAKARAEVTAILSKNPDHKEAKALLRAL